MGNFIMLHKYQQLICKKKWTEYIELFLAKSESYTKRGAAQSPERP